MFYKDKMHLYTTNKVKDDYGSLITSYSLNKSIDCDKQPYSRQLLFKEYGYDLDCTNRVFCDLDEELDDGVIVSFNDDTTKYRVQKALKWDDYMDVMVIQNV